MNHKDLLFNDNPVKAVTDRQTVTGAEKGSCDRFFPSGMDGVAPPCTNALTRLVGEGPGFFVQPGPSPRG